MKLSVMIRVQWLLLKLRWFSWRFRRRTGLNVSPLLKATDAAAQHAYERALLIDPTDIEAAEQARDRAFGEALKREQV